MTAPPPLPGSLDDLITPGIWAFERRRTEDHQPRGGVVTAVHRTDTGTVAETIVCFSRAGWRTYRLHAADIDPDTFTAHRARAELGRVEQRIVEAFGAANPEQRDPLRNLVRIVRKAQETT